MEQSVKGLLNRAFQVEAYSSTFPFVFSQENFKWHFVLTGPTPDKVAAFCAGRVLIWNTPLRSPVRALCLGSVCSEKERSGLASEVLGIAVAESERQNLDACLLFSEARTLYERLGFEPVGSDSFVRYRELFWIASEFNSARQSRFQYSRAEWLWPEASTRFSSITQDLWLAEVKCSPSSLSEFDLDEFRLSLNTPRQMIFWLEDQSGKIVAIARYEKGCDFRRTLYGLFAKDFDWAVQLVTEVLRVRDIDCLLIESFEQEWSQLTKVTKGQEVQLMVRSKDSELVSLFRDRKLSVRGIQSC